MYKLKSMLLSFVFLAIVGSALAFKARFSILKYCTAATNGQNHFSNNICTSVGGVVGEMKFCDFLTTMTTVDQGVGGCKVWCTTTPQDLDGEGLLNDCVDAEGNNTLRCQTTTCLYPD